MKRYFGFMLAVMLLCTSLPVIAHPTDGEVIWMGKGRAGETPDVLPTMYRYKMVGLILYQADNGKYFTVEGDSTKLTKFRKNPDYGPKNNSQTKGFSHIVTTDKYGDIYVNPDMDANPMDYYSQEKKNELGIVYPVFAELCVRKNGVWVPQGGESLRIVLYRKGTSDDYEVEYKKKRYPIFPSEPPKRFIKENKEYSYFTIGNARYIFSFDKIN